MMEKLVSVIMPMYNAERFVDQAVVSVLNQTYTKLELIVINDGSTDRSRLCVQRFSDPRIFIYDQGNRGVSAARNVGLSVMKGDFFCFLDADDFLPLDSIRSRLSLFKDDVDFVDGAVTVYDEAFSVELRTWKPKARGSVYKKLFRLDDSCFFGLTWMIRVKENVHYRFDESVSHGEDLLFLMSLASAGNYDHTHEVILLYRRHERSAMHNSLALGKGYTMLREKMRLKFSSDLSFYDKLLYDLKVRKIMFLVFLKNGSIKLALQYLLSGKLWP